MNLILLMIIKFPTFFFVLIQTRKMNERNRIFILLFFLLSTIISKSQINNNEIVINSGFTVTLTTNIQDRGIPVEIRDDNVVGPFEIGFEFVYFKETYTEFYIGANGYIAFGEDDLGGGRRLPFPIPNTDISIPKNCILGPFQDWDPSYNDASYIFYKSYGDSPNRKLIVSWCDIPLFDCYDSLGSFQIVVNEDSSIENHLIEKPACANLFENKATQGIQNSTGTIGFAVDERNNESWIAKSESCKYIPQSDGTYKIDSLKFSPEILAKEILWFEEGNIYEISSGKSISVSPQKNTVYTAVASLCGNRVFEEKFPIKVIPTPNAFSPNNDGLNDKFKLIAGNLPKGQFQMKIYNRWGQMIFETNDIEDGWDGTYKSELCQEGVYVWIVLSSDNESNVLNKGTVTLIR